MLCADGTLKRNSKYNNWSTRLTLKPADKAHLYEFAAALESTYEPKPFVRRGKCFKPGSIGYNLTINSTKIYKRLLQLGFRDFKLGNPRLIRLIPPKYFGHWLRGFTDGDGTVCLTSANYPAWSVNDKHATILEAISVRLEHMLKVTPLRPHRNNSIYRLDATRRKALTILRFIYKDIGAALPRKLVKYEFIESCYA